MDPPDAAAHLSQSFVVRIWIEESRAGRSPAWRGHVVHVLQRGPGEPWLFAHELIEADAATTRGREPERLGRTLPQSQTHLTDGRRSP